MASAGIAADVLVPEGFEDMSVEGAGPLHVQVKSRVQHRGRFPVGKQPNTYLTRGRSI